MKNSHVAAYHIEKSIGIIVKQNTQKCSTAPGDAAMKAHVHPAPEATALYALSGARKYLNADERRSVLNAIDALPTDRRLFALTLFWTGARLSEVLALRGLSFQPSRGVVAICTLKRRRRAVREIPIPSSLVVALDRRFNLAALGDARLWPWCRTTGWRVIRGIMNATRLSGPAASPRGLRHGFAIDALRHAVPLTLLQKWMGHARLATTAIYADASGPEERAFAQHLWADAGRRRTIRPLHYNPRRSQP